MHVRTGHFLDGPWFCFRVLEPLIILWISNLIALYILSLNTAISRSHIFEEDKMWLQTQKKKMQREVYMCRENVAFDVLNKWKEVQLKQDFFRIKYGICYTKLSRCPSSCLQDFGPPDQSDSPVDRVKSHRPFHWFGGIYKIINLLLPRYGQVALWGVFLYLFIYFLFSDAGHLRVIFYTTRDLSYPRLLWWWYYCLWYVWLLN